MREEHLYSSANSRHHAHTELIALPNGIIHHHEAPVILMDVGLADQVAPEGNEPWEDICHAVTEVADVSRALRWYR